MIDLSFFQELSQYVSRWNCEPSFCMDLSKKWRSTFPPWKKEKWEPASIMPHRTPPVQGEDYSC